jgi:hypothetical protein
MVRAYLSKEKWDDPHLAQLTVRTTRLQQFQVNLGMVRSLAHSATRQQEFQMIVVALEMLFATSLQYARQNDDEAHVHWSDE